MNKFQIKKGLNYFTSKNITPIKVFNNDIKSALSNTKYEEFEEENENENNETNIKDYQKIITRIKKIFITKSNCQKFSYHPLINYTIGKYGDYTLYLKTIFVEIKHYKDDNFLKKETTFFNPNSNSFGVNFQNFFFIFYMHYNNVQIFYKLKENYNITCSSDIKNIRKNYIDLTKKSYIKKYNFENIFKLNTTTNLENSVIIMKNNENIKNPFDDLKDKIIGFTCKKDENIYEIKYGYNKIYIDGFYESREEIKLAFKYPKSILIPKNSLIFLEIKINCDIKKIKKEIFKKIQILKILGLTLDTVFFLGILYNNNYKIDNYDDDEVIFEEDNFKIYIFNCKSYFLGQKINLVQKVFKEEFQAPQVNYISSNTESNSLRNSSLDKPNLRNNLKTKNEKLNEVKKTQDKNLNDNNIEKKKTRSNIKSISNFSLFDDDLLYSQMVFY
jgi:hypothetical protein